MTERMSGQNRLLENSRLFLVTWYIYMALGGVTTEYFSEEIAGVSHRWMWDRLNGARGLEMWDDRQIRIWGESQLINWRMTWLAVHFDERKSGIVNS